MHCFTLLVLNELSLVLEIVKIYLQLYHIWKKKRISIIKYLELKISLC